MVIDDFIDETTRQQLLEFLLHGAPDGHANGAASSAGSVPHGRDSPTADQLVGHAAAAAGDQQAGPELPPGRWERRTADMAGGAATWGVKQHVQEELAAGSLPAMQVCLQLASFSQP